MESAAPVQAELFTVEDVQGYAVLSGRDRRFVQALFEGCNHTEAARRAGIDGSDEYVRKAACLMVRKGKVVAVMNQAWAKAGANIDETLRQATELAKRAFAEAIAAETPERRKAAQALWHQAATLIASIHGKLALRVEGDINHHHTGTVPIPPEALPIMAQMRRDLLTPGRS